MKHPFLCPANWPTIGLLGLGLLAAGPATAQTRPLPAAPQALGKSVPGPHPAGSPDSLLRLYGGMKFGLSLGHFAGQNCYGSSTGWQPGAMVGLLLLRPLSRYTAWQAEVLFSQKGASQANYAYVYRDPAFSCADNTYRATLAYLDVPVLAAFGPGAGTARQGPFAVAGPQLSVALEKREYVHPTGERFDSPHEETISTDAHALTPVSASYVVGVGYRWAKFQNACVSLELRYTGDFTYVYRDGYGAGSLCPSLSSRLTNGVLQLQVSALFGKVRRSAQVPPTPVPTPTQPPVWPPRPPRPTLPTPNPRQAPPDRTPRQPGEGGQPRNQPSTVPAPSTPAPRQDAPVIAAPQDAPATQTPRQEPTAPQPRQPAPRPQP